MKLKEALQELGRKVDKNKAYDYEYEQAAALIVADKVMELEEQLIKLEEKIKWLSFTA